MVKSNEQGRRPNWAAPFWLAAALASAFVVGGWLMPSERAAAEVRKGPPPAAFKSGSARSQAVLQDIAATLKRIEARLERFETSLKHSQPPTSNAAPQVKEAPRKIEFRVERRKP